MNFKKQKILIITTALLTLSFTMLHAVDSKKQIAPMATTSYLSMTTEVLEQEVEKRTIEGNLPFDMGLELMKRWTEVAD
ncbi:MAG: hypothetical protein Q9M36_05035 [Sulfurovum sp.]|nr:hypothetical protein [Sulfurovum sp.]